MKKYTFYMNIRRWCLFIRHNEKKYVRISVSATQTFSLQQALDQIRKAIEFVNSTIINRTEVIDQIFCALLMREHALIQSRTGAAKSLLAQQIFSMFEGANTFQVQASKEQQPDTYFGGLDIEQLKKGKIIHNTANSLVESEFGFIDEIFDANDYTLRALLTTLNERALILGVQHVEAKVHTVIAATNYLRVSEITEALLDRFVFKALFVPAKIASVQFRIARRYLVHQGKPFPPKERIPYTTLLAISNIVKGQDPSTHIDIPGEMIFFANSVVRHYEMQRNRLMKEKPQEHQQLKDFYISPRTYTRSMDMLRVSAFLHGRTVVSSDDVGKLWYLHTTVGITQQRELFQKSYETILHQLSAAKAFDQMRKLLDFQEVIERLRENPALLKQPLHEIDGMPTKRSLLEWAKDTLGITNGSVEQNRKLLEAYLESFVPVTEELHDFKNQQEKDIHELFHPASHIWT